MTNEIIITGVSLTNVLAGVIIFFIKRLIKRIDEHHEDIQQLKTTMAVHDEQIKQLQKLITA